MYKRSFHGDYDLSRYRFLISGGAGFIGSNIAEYLCRWNAGKVRVLDNYITGRKENVAYLQQFPQFEFMEGDIRNLDDCKKAAAGMDFVSHQAALGSVPRSINDPIATNHHNVNGFLNMMVAARDAGVQKIVYASSSSVYGDHPALPKVESEIGKPLSPYAVSKYVNELYASVFASCYGMQIVGLRYFNVFGPRQDPNGQYAAVIPRFIDHLLQGKTISVDGDGEQTRDFTFVENAVQANVRGFFAEKVPSASVFNVAVGENFSVNQMWGAIQKVFGKEGQAVHQAARAGDIRNSLADISRTRKYLQYEPVASLEEGLQYLKEYMERKL